MSLDVQIKVDPGASLSTSNAVEAALGRVENKGPKIGAALKKGFGDSSTAAEKAKHTAESLGEQFERTFKMIGIGLGVRELAELSDRYTEIGNKLRVIAGDESNFNSLMSQTKDIANETRTSWDATATTFQRLTNVTRELGLTQKDVLGLTREMAEAAKISGASTFEAQMAMAELTHSFATGVLQGREFKVLMRDTPAMMHELQVASGHTAAEFAEMGKHGKISAELLVDWFDKAKVSIHDKFGQQVPTVTETIANMKTELEQAVGEFAKAIDLVHSLGAAFKDLTDGLSTATGIITKASSALSSIKNALPDWAVRALGTAFEYATHPLKPFTDAYGALKEKIEGSGQPITVARIKILELSLAAEHSKIPLDAMRASLDRLGHAFYSGFLTGVVDEMDRAARSGPTFAEQLGDATAHVAGFVAAVGSKNGLHALLTNIDPWLTATDAVKQHAKVLSDEEKWLEKIRGPEEEQARGMAAIAKLYREGAISLAQYREQLELLYALRGNAPPTPSATKPGMVASIPGVTDLHVPTPAETKAMGANRDWLTNAKAKQYEQWEQHSIDAISGVDRALKSLRVEILDVGKTVEESIVGAFHHMNDAIVQSVTTGKLEFGQLFDYIEHQLVRLALQKLEAGILTALFPGLGPAASLPSLVGGSQWGSETAIPHAANGFSGRIGGAGGTDSKLFMSWVTPGEFVSIRTPQEVSAAQRAANRPAQVHVHNYDDTRGALAGGISSGAYDIHLMNWAKRNKGALQALIKK